MPSVLNTTNDLATFFGVSEDEFYEFWNSLTFLERYYYRTVDLKTGRSMSRVEVF